MEKFTQLTGVAAPLPMINIDTDKIFPAVYLKTIKRTGLAKWLFQEIRFRPDGSENPDFVLNKPAYRNAKVLVAGDNFGCGSSREHAAWALTGFGFRAIISTSFADIFTNNALKNGLLPVVVGTQKHKELAALLRRAPDSEVMIDLARQTLVLPDGKSTSFPIDGFSKTCLLDGIDELGYILSFEREIAEYEATHPAQRTV